MVVINIERKGEKDGFKGKNDFICFSLLQITPLPFLFLLKGQNHYKNVKPYGKGDRSPLKRE